MEFSFTFNEDVIHDYSLYTYMPQIDYNKDTDGDGIPDYNEEKIGTDKNSIDTDGDGLVDYIELEIGYSPLEKDTDKNGVSDGQEDFDRDNIVNSEEDKLGANMCYYDTDGDYLSDYDEVYTYMTSPKLEDTDMDSLSDSAEIYLNLNPLDKDTDGDGIDDANDVVSHKFDAKKMMDDYDKNVYPIIELSGSGKVLESFEVSAEESSYIINRRIPGYIGTAYNFTTDDVFETAKVTFVINEELFEQSNFYPAIYYYNQEIQLLELVENQTIRGNCVEAELEHFSTYIVLNKIEFDKVWENEIVYWNEEEEKKPIDLGFVIDASGSMSYDRTPKNDPNGLRLTLSKEMVSKMGEEDRALVVKFSSSASLLLSLTEDKTEINTAIDKIGSSGRTAMIDGIKLANDNFINYSDDTHKKIMIVITDGMDNSSSYNVNYIINQAKENDICIYTIGLGKELSVTDLKKIAKETGGKYYFASTVSDLGDIYDDIGDETIDYTADSNGDDITDYHTKLLCEGKLTTGTGISVFEGIPYEEIQKNDDYDGDGLKNGEEIIVKQKNLTTYVTMVSHPTTEYSDADAYTDYEEIKVYDTDALKANVIMDTAIIDYLGNEEAFWASIYEGQYLQSESKSIFTWIGNNIYGSNYDEIEIYKDMLIDFFVANNNKLNKEISDEIDYKQLQQIFAEISLVFEETRSKLAKRANAADELDYIMDLEKYLEHLKKAMAEVSGEGFGSKEDFYKYVDALKKQIVKVSEQCDELRDGLDREILVKTNVETLAQTEGAWKVGKLMNWGCNLLQWSVDGYAGYNDYLNTIAAMETIQSNVYILEVLSERAYYDNLQEAAQVLLINAKSEQMSMWEEVKQGLINATINMGVHAVIAKIPVIGFWTELAIGLCSLFIPVEDTAKYAVRICGEACVGMIMYNDLFSCAFSGFQTQHDGKYIYVLYGEDAKKAVNKYVNVIEIRKFGENDMIELQVKGPKWMDWILELFGSDSKIIIESCNSNINFLNTFKYRYSNKCWE